MSRTWLRFGVPALVCAIMLASGVASAGISVGIGIGSTFGPHYHHHHMYGAYVYGPWPEYHYYDPWWYDPWYYPAPVVVTPPPVVREHVIVKEHLPPAPPKEPDLVGDKLQQKKSETLKKLKIGDANSRVQAVKELEPYESDTKVRTALEQALLSDWDPQVRKTVAEMFGRLQDKKTLRVLKQANKDDSDRSVRQAAYKAIILIEGY